MNIELRQHNGCIHDDACEAFADDLYKLLAGGPYDYPVSLLRLDDMDTYLGEHRTARRRASRARRLGYEFAGFDRADFADDVYAINTSMPVRQGKPMSPGYLEHQDFTRLPEYPCPRHRIDTWGVFRKDELVAYIVLYVSGDLALVSQILGHGDHLENDVMYLLAVEAFGSLPKPATVFYNRWDSGQNGLRFFKSRLGFEPERAEWAA